MAVSDGNSSMSGFAKDIYESLKTIRESAESGEKYIYQMKNEGNVVVIRKTSDNSQSSESVNQQTLAALFLKQLNECLSDKKLGKETSDLISKEFRKIESSSATNLSNKTEEVSAGIFADPKQDDKTLVSSINKLKSLPAHKQIDSKEADEKSKPVEDTYLLVQNKIKETREGKLKLIIDQFKQSIRNEIQKVIGEIEKEFLSEANSLKKEFVLKALEEKAHSFMKEADLFNETCIDQLLDIYSENDDESFNECLDNFNKTNNNRVKIMPIRKKLREQYNLLENQYSQDLKQRIVEINKDQVFAFSQGREGNDAVLGQGVCLALTYQWSLTLSKNPKKEIHDERDLVPEGIKISSKVRFNQAYAMMDEFTKRKRGFRAPFEIPGPQLKKDSVEHSYPLDFYTHSMSGLIDRVVMKKEQWANPNGIFNISTFSSKSKNEMQEKDKKVEIDKKEKFMSIEEKGGEVKKIGVGSAIIPNKAASQNAIIVEKESPSIEKGVLKNFGDLTGGHAMGMQIDDTNKIYRFWDVNTGFYQYESLDAMRKGVDEQMKTYYPDHNVFCCSQYVNTK